MKSPLLDRRPFVPARYAELRTEATAVLQRACDSFAAANDKDLARAVADGQRVLREMDDLWHGRGGAA